MHTSLIDRIEQLNIKRHNSDYYISHRLLFLIVGKNLKKVKYESLTLDEMLYVKINSLDYDFAEKFGLSDYFYVNNSSYKGMTKEELVEWDELIQKSTGLTKKERFRKSIVEDFNFCIEDAIKLKNYFNRYNYSESQLISKSNTLSILTLIKRKGESREYLQIFFEVLSNSQISTEFPLESFRYFYEKLIWFNRIGFNRGLEESDYKHI